MAMAAPADAKPIDAATNAADDVFKIVLSMMYLSVFMNTLIQRVTADTGANSALFQKAIFFSKFFELLFYIKYLDKIFFASAKIKYAKEGLRHKKAGRG
jgi:uncharacterized membrane protein